MSNRDNAFVLPLYLWQELCLEDASCLECFRNLPSEQESSLGHIYQDIPHNFPEVHAAAHFLISVKYTQETNTLKESLSWRVSAQTRVSGLKNSDIFGMQVGVWAGLSPLFAWVKGEVIHGTIVLRPNVIKAAIVSESPPLHVDTHLSLVSFYHLNIPHLLHVTRITAGAYNQTPTSE